jgi:hypothetical protein
MDRCFGWGVVSNYELEGINDDDQMNEVNSRAKRATMRDLGIVYSHISLKGVQGSTDTRFQG